MEILLTNLLSVISAVKRLVIGPLTAEIKISVGTVDRRAKALRLRYEDEMQVLDYQRWLR